MAKKISIVRARCIGDSVYVEFSDHTRMAYSAEFLHEHGEPGFPGEAGDLCAVKQPVARETNLFPIGPRQAAGRVKR